MCGGDGWGASGGVRVGDAGQGINWGANEEAQAGGYVGMTAEDRERARKGKGILYEGGHGARRDESQLPNPIQSGSGSCDPLDMGAHKENNQADSFSLVDADSEAGPALKLGSTKERPVVISSDNGQDIDLGGEGMMSYREGGPSRVVVKRERAEEGAKADEEMTEAAGLGDGSDLNRGGGNGEGRAEPRRRRMGEGS